MAPSTISVSSDEAENECFNFVVNKVFKYQPISLQALHGFMSCISRKSKTCMGTSTLDLLTYLRNSPEVFKIEKGKVSLLAHPKKFGVQPTYDSNSNSDDSYPDEIESGVGIVNRIFPMFGFMTIESPPLETSVYFSSLCFEDSSKKLLNSFIEVGDRMGFSAKKSSRNPSASYRAKYVWFLPADKIDDDNCSRNYKDFRCTNNDTRNVLTSVKHVSKPNPVEQKSRDLRPISKEDYSSKKNRHSGKIINMFDNFGFIKFQRDVVYFHISHIVEQSTDAINLNKLCKVNDNVEFTCVPSTNKKHKAKFIAEKVWLRIETPMCETFDSNSDLSSDESIPNSPSVANVIMPSEFKDHGGKIYPNTNNKAEIKVLDCGISVLAENCAFYIKGQKVDELMWHFNERDDVMFDAIKENDEDGDPYWTATLVWVGKKPILTEPVETNGSSEKVKDNSPLSVANNKHSSYSSWGDSPYEGEFSNDHDAKDASNDHDAEDASNDVDINEHDVDINEHDVDINEITYSQASMSKTEDTSFPCEVKVDNSAEKLTNGNESRQNNNLEDELQPNKTHEQTPGVYMFDGLETGITKVHRFLALGNCDSLRKPISFLLSDMYWKGQLLRDQCTDPRSLISEGDLVYVNGFEIIDNERHLWHKVTLAWVGQRPKKFSDMEPADFIVSQALQVPDEIPTWKQFRKEKQNHHTLQLEKSMGPLKNLPVDKTVDKLSIPAVAEGETDGASAYENHEDGSGATSDDFLLHEFALQRNTINKLREQFSSFNTIKQYDELSSQLEQSRQCVLNYVHQLRCDLLKTSSVAESEIQAKDTTVQTKTVAVQTFKTGEIITMDIFPQ